jgi:hypothetical protein
VAAGVSAFESLVAAGASLTRAQAEDLLADPDLVSVGMLAEQARKALSGDRIAYGRVLLVASDQLPVAGDHETALAGLDQAGEVRLTGAPASADEAVARVRQLASAAIGRTITGYSLKDLLDLAGGDHLAIADLARALRAAGLDAIAEAPLDLLGDTENTIEVVRATLHGGLAVRRATIAQAAIAERLDLIERAVLVQEQTSALKAFAPLPREDPADAPSTGYDDVRTVAAARLMARTISFIQVDWPLYGPKLAQVAITYGANDIDGVAVVDALKLGPRRSPKEEIERQIRAAGAAPAERDGRYEWRT